MKMKPSRLKSRKLAGENQYFSIFYDFLEENDGTPTEDYIVVHPKLKTNQGIYAVSVRKLQQPWNAYICEAVINTPKTDTDHM